MSTLNVLRNLFLTAVLIPVASLGACTSTPDAQPSSPEPERSAMYGELEQETDNYPAWSEKKQANSDLLAPEMTQSPYLDDNKHSSYSKSKIRMSRASKKGSEKVALSRQTTEDRSKKRKK